jgi:hypothetical protein
VDAAINLGFISQGSLILHKKQLQDSIFSVHKVTRAQFDSSMTWYSTQLPELQQVYEKVTIRLNQMHAEAQQ